MFNKLSKNKSNKNNKKINNLNNKLKLNKKITNKANGPCKKLKILFSCSVTIEFRLTYSTRLIILLPNNGKIKIKRNRKTIKTVITNDLILR